MNQDVSQVSTVPYGSSTIGVLRSNLAGLQGYDIMALELIQNADDAKAKKIIFDITDQGLLVRNSGQFSYCGHLTNECTFPNKSKCDFHHIIKVASGSKSLREGNIGRFGIGFVSVYQITDRPEIRSSGIKLVIKPELEECEIFQYEEPNGTSLFLPWAREPLSLARQELDVAHICDNHIDQLTNDFLKVLRESLLFLRHIQNAEVWRDGKLLLACDLKRESSEELVVSFRPDGNIQRWHILRTDAAEAANRLYLEHPQLKTKHRSTKISIGFRTEPQSVDAGLLYAFLPTEQSTGLPIHINADFFPEPDRKTVVLNGHQFQKAWNEMLIGVAAAELARDLGSLLEPLGFKNLWQLINRAYELYTKPSDHPPCYKLFWERIKETAPSALIVKADDGNIHVPSGVLIPGTKYKKPEKNVFQEIGARLVNEQFQSFHVVMKQLGAQNLTLERLVNALETWLESASQVGSEISNERLQNFYKPLWHIINGLLPDGERFPLTAVAERLSELRIFVTEDLFIVNIKQTYIAPSAIDALRVTELLPRLAVASRLVESHPKIVRMFHKLDLKVVASHINTQCRNKAVRDVISDKVRDLRDLYSLFSDLDDLAGEWDSSYCILQKLPIWLSSKGLVKTTQALLPGDFTDPTGQADLFDESVFTSSSRSFLINKLGVEEQTIDAFVLNVVPTFFNEDGPLDASKYSQLISELAWHPNLLDNEELRELLKKLPLMPTMNGGWSQPVDTYYRADALVKVLGDAQHLWVDTSRIPNIRSIRSFLKNLGVRQEPSPRHLVKRILSIAEHSPTDQNKKACAEAFYVLNDMYEREKDTVVYRNALSELQYQACFPAEGDSSEWHMAADLYAPYRAEAFSTQAKILGFRNTKRLKTDLLEDLGVTTSPETSLVVDHLLHCVSKNIAPHVSTYSVLSERAVKDDVYMERLRGERCIYIESKKIFVKPNQVYWVAQRLGQYAYSIPENHNRFRSFYDAVGVKNTPDGMDYAGFLIEIANKYDQQAKPIGDDDLAIYGLCLNGVASAHERGELLDKELDLLRVEPSILNLKKRFSYPDEILLKDSEWHAEFFGEDLEEALCKPLPELWPLFQSLGVSQLSDKTSITLDSLDGYRASEEQVANDIKQRIGVLRRLLHNKALSVHKKLHNALSNITAESYEVVLIQASVDVSGNSTEAPCKPVNSFFDIQTNKLILARPVNKKSWTHILNALFHQLMPEESGADISTLAINARQFMSIPIEDAHRDLSDFGVPELNGSLESMETDGLMSSQLDDIEISQESVPPEDDDNAPDLAQEDSNQSQIKTLPSHSTRRGKPEKRAELSSPVGRGGTSLEGNESDNVKQAKKPSGADDYSSFPENSSSHKKKSPAKYKEQRDRKLFSYVQHQQRESDESSGEGRGNEHNLNIEIISRGAVSKYEKERGRVVEQMPQTHPGYDIISRNPVSGEVRYVEVKGINGEWNQTGVGLSCLQFSTSQKYGNQYWLYVVELVSDQKNMRVHPIQNPSAKVTSFMFNENWRDVAAKEIIDPTAMYIPGARISHRSMGEGVIIDVSTRGKTKLLTIQFDGKPQPTRNVALNLHSMELAGADYVDNDT